MSQKMDRVPVFGPARVWHGSHDTWAHNSRVHKIARTWQREMELQEADDDVKYSKR